MNMPYEEFPQSRIYGAASLSYVFALLDIYRARFSLSNTASRHLDLAFAPFIGVGTYICVALVASRPVVDIGAGMRQYL